MEKYELTIYASYFQFVVMDQNSSDDISHLWDENTVKDMLIMGRDIIGIGTVRDLTVPVAVEILNNKPSIDQSFDDWDQVVDAGIEVPSGNLVVMGVTDYFLTAARIPVAIGKHRIRIYYGGLDSLSPDGTEGDDHYKIALWKSDHDSDVMFLKRRQTV